MSTGVKAVIRQWLARVFNNLRARIADPRELTVTILIIRTLPAIAAACVDEYRAEDSAAGHAGSD
jgi:hypothetical protein